MSTQVREGDWVRVSIGMDGLGKVTEVDEARGCVEVRMQDGREVRLGAEWVVPVDFEAESESILGATGPRALPDVALILGWQFFVFLIAIGAAGGALASVLVWFFTRGN